MFIDFSNKLCKNLIAMDFNIISANEGTLLSDGTQAVALAKNLSPVLYIVNIINTQTMTIGEIEEKIEPINLNIEKILNRMYCSYGVCINLLVTKGSSEKFLDFVNTKEYITGEKINQIWWIADIEKGKLICGEHQPTKLQGIEKAVYAALDSQEEVYNEPIIIKDMERRYKQASILPVVSKAFPVTKALLAINIFIWTVLYLSGYEKNMIKYFANSSVGVLENAEYYRLVTSMFLHGSLTHLSYNSLSLFIFGSRAEQYFGSLKFVFIYFVAGICGSLFSVFFTKAIAVGASGAIFGITGALLAFSQQKKRDIAGFTYFTLLMFAVVGIMLGFINTGVDNFAHIGGILGGFVIQTVFNKLNLVK